MLGQVPVQAVAQVRPQRQRPRIAIRQNSRKDNPTNGRAPELSPTGSPRQTRPIDTFLVPLVAKSELIVFNPVMTTL